MADASRPGAEASRPKLGVIAGRGSLPRRIVQVCRRGGRDYFVLALEGQTDPATVEGAPHGWIRLGAVGGALSCLKNAGCRDIVMAGGVTRPSFLSLRPDARGVRLLSKIGLKSLGDDALLKLIVAELESEGMRVVGVEAVLDGILTPEGIVGAHCPDGAGMSDIRRGLEAVRAIGLADIGQASVVQGGLVLAVEAIEGTDAMLARCADLAREGPGGVLVKASKPQQDNRTDLPAIGPDTIVNAQAAGLRGVAIEAGRTLLIDRDVLIESADRLNMFVFGVRSSDA